MRVGPSTPIGAGRLALDLVGRHHERAVGQRLDAGLGADGDLEAAVEHVVQQGDDDVLLLEDAEHLADGLDRVERRRHARGAADEDVLVARRVSAARRVDARDG